MGTETADFHCGMAIFRDFRQALEPAPASLWCGRGGEARAHPGMGIRRQGELRHQQQAAAGIGQRAVHLAVFIRENPVAEQALAHALRLRFAIAGLHRNQSQKTRADAADGCAVHFHGRGGDALDQGNHRFTQPVQSRIWDFVDFMRWYVAILYFLLRLTGRMPLRFLHWIGTGLGWLLWRLPNPLRRKAVMTLSHVRTQFDGKSSHALLKPALIEMGRGALELCKIWSGKPHAALALIREVRGLEHFDAALAARRGLIIAAPHLGCWELLNFWLCSRTPIAIAYRPPRRAEIEPLLIKVRGVLAAEQVRAEGTAGVRALFRRLSAGGVVGILPDQQPKAGEGEFAPFFGTPALTMVLLPRLAQRTGAAVLFAFAERLPSGAGFRIHILPAPEVVANSDLPTAVTALNRGIEDCVRIAPAQYQWAYMRYSIRPPDAAVTPSADA